MMLMIEVKLFNFGFSESVVMQTPAHLKRQDSSKQFNVLYILNADLLTRGNYKFRLIRRRLLRYSERGNLVSPLRLF